MVGAPVARHERLGECGCGCGLGFGDDANTGQVTPGSITARDAPGVRLFFGGREARHRHVALFFSAGVAIDARERTARASDTQGAAAVVRALGDAAVRLLGFPIHVQITALDAAVGVAGLAGALEALVELTVVSAVLSR